MSDYAQPYTVDNLDFYRTHHGQQLYYRWEGTVSWRPEPNAPLEPIFAIAGMNATKAFIRPDQEYGEAGHRINRELGLYCDLKTGEVLTRWQPFPGWESVPVVPIANRIVQGRVKPRKIEIPAGEPYLKTVLEIPLAYPHPLAGNPIYRDHCPGDTFEGTEYFTTYTRRPEAKNVPPPTWGRDCPWLPWMKLGYQHPARLRFDTTIERVERFEDLNPKLIQVIRDRVPIYQTTPDQTDEPNVTSTTYLKQHFAAYQRGATFPIPEYE
ncbi:MAG: DUF1838 domain-containing protein [Leptolyngbya sp. SIO4C1]|nr:DUF1838 domain-containing protein [Leptolyngbya sp. SIO4C1]